VSTHQQFLSCRFIVLFNNNNHHNNEDDEDDDVDDEDDDVDDDVDDNIDSGKAYKVTNFLTKSCQPYVKQLTTLSELSL